MTRIFIVNDSIVVTSVMSAIIESEPEFVVIGTASNGLDAIRSIERLNPDLVIMDIHMPKMNGIEAVKQIMKKHAATRILIATATVNNNANYIFEGLKYGAVDFIQTPELPFPPGTVIDKQTLRSAGAKLINKIKSASMTSPKFELPTENSNHAISCSNPDTFVGIHEIAMIGIGCSTGGPSTLCSLLRRLPKPFHVPILVCQHIDEGFDKDFSEWLSKETNFNCEIAKHRTIPKPNNIYIAPAGKNMAIAKNYRIELNKPEHMYVPNINYLFESMSQSLGNQACGVVLTGMGNDGAKGLKAIKDAGGDVFIQDADSAVISGMPKAAMESTGVSGHSIECLASYIKRWAMH